MRKQNRIAVPPNGIDTAIALEPNKERKERMREAYTTVYFPEILRSKLSGTPEEITALRQYEDALEKEIDVEDKVFEVILEGVATKTVYVQAKTKEEAREAAKDGDYYDEEETEYESMSVVEVIEPK